MKQLVSLAAGNPLLKRLALSFGLHRIINRYLKSFPKIQVVPGTGVKYRASRVESLPLAEEMFLKKATYDTEFIRSLTDVQTFADLGCNVGYFGVLMASLFPRTTFRGIMVDANPEIVAEAKWHCENNPQLHGVISKWGIVGAGKTGESDFYLYRSSICSSREPVVNDPNLTGKWKPVKVPAVSLELEWASSFGGATCDLLKVDVEGAELDLLKQENVFLKRVRNIILEWHKWEVQLPELEALLGAEGFALHKIFEESEQMGTCFFTRKG